VERQSVERGAWSVERGKCYDAVTLYAPTLHALRPHPPGARQSPCVRIPPKDLNAHSNSPSLSRARFPLWPSVVIAVLAVSAGVVLFWFDPSRSPFYPTCQFHRLTGLQCPGCGSLRALHQLLHGRLAAAFQLNALLVISLPALAWWAARLGIHLWKRQPLADGIIRPAWLWCALAATFAFGLLRNLPLPQLAWLNLQP